jgi:polygalacturonase
MASWLATTLCFVAELPGTRTPIWPLRSHTTGGSLRSAVANLTAFGAIGDGKTDNTRAFQRAAAFLVKAGGGVLIVPLEHGGRKSVYVTNPLRFNISHLTLRLEASVRILAKCNIEDWPSEDAWASFGGAKQYVPFVSVVGGSDFSMDGSGILDGNGSCFWSHQQGHHSDLPYQRPRLMVVESVDRVSIAGVTFANSPFWCLVFYNSNDVHVSGITVLNPSGGKGACGSVPAGEKCFGPNADGIDLVSVRRALIEDSHITAGDDCVCIKSGANAAGRAANLPTIDVLVRNMSLHSCSCPHTFRGFGDGCGGLKVGTEMSGGVHNILFEDTQIDYAGIALKLSAPLPRGGNVSNITWRNIDVQRAGMLVNIEDGNNIGTTPAKPEEFPLLTDITVANVSLANCSCDASIGVYGCGVNAGWLLQGNATGQAPLRGLTIHNVSARPGAGKPLAWKCDGGTQGIATDVTPSVTCLAPSDSQ